MGLKLSQIEKLLPEKEEPLTIDLMLKTASELERKAIVGDGVTLRSNNLAKQRLKETIFDQLKRRKILRSALNQRNQRKGE